MAVEASHEHNTHILSLYKGDNVFANSYLFTHPADTDQHHNFSRQMYVEYSLSLYLCSLLTLDAISGFDATASTNSVVPCCAGCSGFIRMITAGCFI